VLECVVNISEGRRQEVVDTVAAACGAALLDVHVDPDHHRSVLTLAGTAHEVAEAALALARAAVGRIDLSAHSGVHPRLGAVDVVPFVPLEGVVELEAGGGAGEDEIERAGPVEPAGQLAGRRGEWAAGGDEPELAAEAARRRGERAAGGDGPELAAEAARRRGERAAGGDGLELAGEVARRWGERAADELGVPVFLYGAADPEGRTLPDVRRTAFRERRPDFGPHVPHPTAGAMAVGARPVLVAVNCELAAGGGGLEADLAVAKAVAGVVRERNGGLPGVRALGFALASKGRAQVSMNLTDLAATGVEAACEAVRRAAAEREGAVMAVELVGLLPAAELERCSGEFLAWSGLSADRTIEARLLVRPDAPATKPGRSEE
jgi:glutamate formiminotransferase